MTVADKMNVMQMRTVGTTQVVVRDARGQKIFDMDLHGCTVIVTTPAESPIRVAPAPMQKPSPSPEAA